MSRPEHNFSQPRFSWERTVIENAQYYTAICLAARHPNRTHAEFSVLEHGRSAALRQAIEVAEKVAYGVCVYAVTESGRSTIVDRKDWETWKEYQCFPKPPPISKILT